MDRKVDTNFKPEDANLKKLVDQRREEVVRMQQGQAEHHQRLENRGQARKGELRRNLPKEFADVLDNMEKMQDKQQADAEKDVEATRARLIASSPATDISTEVGPATGPEIVATVTPYYGVLHGSDGSVYWQGYNPGNIDLWDRVWGSGSGLFGTGASSFTVYMDWWFSFLPPETRWYSHYIYTLFHGFYIVRSDDGWWDSKFASVNISQEAIGYQYNYKASASINIFGTSGDNIDVNSRLDSWKYQYYSDLLGGGDTAYLRVTASYYVYARGSGSYAELNFSDGTANYMGTPTVYVY